MCLQTTEDTEWCGQYFELRSAAWVDYCSYSGIKARCPVSCKPSVVELDILAEGTTRTYSDEALSTMTRLIASAAELPAESVRITVMTVPSDSTVARADSARNLAKVATLRVDDPATLVAQQLLETPEDADPDTHEEMSEQVVLNLAIAVSGAAASTHTHTSLLNGLLKEPADLEAAMMAGGVDVKINSIVDPTAFADDDGALPPSADDSDGSNTVFDSCADAPGHEETTCAELRGTTGRNNRRRKCKAGTYHMTTCPFSCQGMICRDTTTPPTNYSQIGACKIDKGCEYTWPPGLAPSPPSPSPPEPSTPPQLPPTPPPTPSMPMHEGHVLPPECADDHTKCKCDNTCTFRNPRNVVRTRATRAVPSRPSPQHSCALWQNVLLTVTWPRPPASHAECRRC